MLQYELMNEGARQPKRRKSVKGQKSWMRLLTVFLGYLVITVFLAYILGSTLGGFDGLSSSETEEIPVSELVIAISNEEVESILVEDDALTATYKDGSVKNSVKESGISFAELLERSGVENPNEKVKIEVGSPLFGGFLGIIISNLLPILVMIIFFLFLFRQAGRSAGGMFDFGRSNAKVFDKKGQKVTFKDAAGVREAKSELEEVVDFLKNPNKYRKLGARIPKGVLLVGPAGTGKTLLARAVANEANVPFFSMAGSEFMEMLVGVGASRVRDLFSKAKENSPALIFIDEIESIGRQRGQTVVTSHGEQEQTLNQILVEMDGFTPTDHVIVIAATNRPDLLDSALTRPGRFDRTVMLQIPDIEGRLEIVKIHMKNKPIAENVNLERLAKRTVGFSGADIENMLNEAAILAARRGKKEIETADLEDSITKVKLGRESSRVQSEEDKKMTAYHEAGHAIVAKKLPNMDSVHRVSIVSRGMALGFTEINPDRDKHHQTKTDIINQITALLGGRAAEQLIFKDMTVGAGNDLEKASLLAYKMVTEFGMSDLGPIAFTDNTLGNSRGTNPYAGNRFSQEMAAKIDVEVKKIIDTAFNEAAGILKDEQRLLVKVSEELMERETLEQDEFDKIVEEME